MFRPAQIATTFLKNKFEIPRKCFSNSKPHLSNQALEETVAKFQQVLKDELAKLDADKKKLSQDQAHLRAAKALWDAHELMVSQRAIKAQEVVQLNFGGEVFTTTRTTLTKYPNTPMWAMFNGQHELPKDSQGRVFFDRNPKYFPYLLDWLRHGVAPKPEDLTPEVIQGIRSDLFFFGELGLTDFLKTTQDLRDYTLIVSPKCTETNPGNSKWDLQSDGYCYGALAKSAAPGDPGASIEVIFPKAVWITGMTVAPYMYKTWDPTSGACASIELYDGNKWRQVGVIPENFGQFMLAHDLRWDGCGASRCRLSHPNAIGLSRLLFH